jgi:4'-phosphopantetheinyl transferase
MAIAYRQQVDDDTEFALWKIEEEAEDLYSQLQLHADEQAYYEKLNKSKRHLHWLGTRVLLRKMLKTDEYIDCKVDTHGKPYLVNLPHHISLSHSFDYAAVMISRSRPVGIDIEQIKQKVERIAGKFMSPHELAFISNDSYAYSSFMFAGAPKRRFINATGERKFPFWITFRWNHLLSTGMALLPPGLTKAASALITRWNICSTRII